MHTVMSIFSLIIWRKGLHIDIRTSQATWEFELEDQNQSVVSVQIPGIMHLDLNVVSVDFVYSVFYMTIK